MTAPATPPYRQVAPVVDGPGWTAPVVTDHVGRVFYSVPGLTLCEACSRLEDGLHVLWPCAQVDDGEPS